MAQDRDLEIRPRRRLIRKRGRSGHLDILAHLKRLLKSFGTKPAYFCAIVDINLVPPLVVAKHHPTNPNRLSLSGLFGRKRMKLMEITDHPGLGELGVK